LVKILTMIPLTFFQNEKLVRLSALVACGFGALACLAVTIKLGSALLPPTEIASAPAISAQPSALVPASPEASIAKWHLFGNPEAGMAKAAGAPTNHPLNLYLRGTLALENPRMGMAVIADEQGEHAYHVGEMVADGARLDSVYTDHVVVVHEGMVKTLTLPKLEESPTTTPPSAVSTQRANDRIAASSTKNMASSSKSTPTKSADQNLVLNPAELARQIQAVPVMEGGKLAGVRLNPGNQVALLSKYGWQPNDIVTAINGTSVMSLSNPQQLLDNLKTGGQIQVTVRRDGKPATLTVSLR